MLTHSRMHCAIDLGGGKSAIFDGAVCHVKGGDQRYPVLLSFTTEQVEKLASWLAIFKKEHTSVDA